MSYFSDQEQQALAARLAPMTNPVRLVLFTQAIGCETCPATERSLRSLAEVNPLLTVDVRNPVLDAEDAATYGVSRVPGIAIIGERDYGMRFYGAPDGYEMVSLLEGILLASAGDSQLSDEARATIATLSSPRHLQIFSTPTCPHCPKAVRLGWQMAIESEHVRTDAISAVEYPDLVQQHRVTGVPKTVIDGTADILGAVPETQFVETVVGAAPPAS